MWQCRLVGARTVKTLCRVLINIFAGLTEAETVQELTSEEQRASAVPGYIALHDVSLLGFITTGLQIEEQK